MNHLKLRIKRYKEQCQQDRHLSEGVLFVEKENQSLWDVGTVLGSELKPLGSIFDMILWCQRTGVEPIQPDQLRWPFFSHWGISLIRLRKVDSMMPERRFAWAERAGVDTEFSWGGGYSIWTRRMLLSQLPWWPHTPDERHNGWDDETTAFGYPGNNPSQDININSWSNFARWFSLMLLNNRKQFMDETAAIVISEERV